MSGQKDRLFDLPLLGFRGFLRGAIGRRSSPDRFMAVQADFLAVQIDFLAVQGHSLAVQIDFMAERLVFWHARSICWHPGRQKTFIFA